MTLQVSSLIHDMVCPTIKTLNVACVTLNILTNHQGMIMVKATVVQAI